MTHHSASWVCEEMSSVSDIWALFMCLRGEVRRRESGGHGTRRRGEEKWGWRGMISAQYKRERIMGGGGRGETGGVLQVSSQNQFVLYQDQSVITSHFPSARFLLHTSVSPFPLLQSPEWRTKDEWRHEAKKKMALIPHPLIPQARLQLITEKKRSNVLKI